MRRESQEFLQALLTTPSPSGFEHRGQRIWLDYAAQFADESYSDTYGNAVAVLNPAGSPRIMIVGHADEIGLMVQHIDDKGFIYPAQIGGHDPGTLPGKRYIIHTKKGPVLGVTGAIAPHLLDKKVERKVGKIHEYFIDIGATSERAARQRVSVGDPIVAADDYQPLHRQIAVARAFDNRVGTWAAAETLRFLQSSRKKLNAAVYAVSAVREETGAKASQLVARQVKADMALITDVTHATDTPGVDQRQYGKCELGGGPAISVGGPVLLEMYERILKVAAAAKIPVQKEISPNRSGTDADAVFIATEGVACGLVSIPLRYMHSTVEMLNLKDLEATPKLFATFCAGLKKGELIKAKI